MTAEVVIMNTLGIAMAADSAVTTEGGQRVFKSAHKLFRLSKVAPVGVLVYGNGHFCGLPWEVIIKDFRARLDAVELPSLPDYLDRLLAYLANPDRPFSNEMRMVGMRRAIDNAFARVIGNIDHGVEGAIRESNGLYHSDVLEVAREHITRARSALESTARYDSVATIGVSNLDQVLVQQIDVSIDRYFSAYHLDDELVSLLREIAVEAILRPWLLNHSGLTVAGYGTDEFYPSAQSCTIGGFFSDHLVFSKRDVRRVSVDTRSIVIPLAQEDTIHLFMEGIDPDYQRWIEESLSSKLLSWTRGVVEELAELAGALDLVRDRIEELQGEWLDSFLAECAARRMQHSSPVSRAVAHLPKDELAALAESLVNLTANKQRVSAAGIETVGGATDVALVSKGDGFVWIRRKDYFPAELNRSFHVNYLRVGGVSQDV